MPTYKFKEIELDPVKGFKVSPAQLDKIVKYESRRIYEKIYKESKEIQKVIRSQIKTHQTFWLPRKHKLKKNQMHWSSKPGHPPNEETGLLRKSVRLKRKLSSFWIELSAKVIKDDTWDYAKDHEFGQRPFFYPTIKSAFSKNSRMQKAIKQVMFAMKNSLQGKLLEEKIRKGL